MRRTSPIELLRASSRSTAACTSAHLQRNRVATAPFAGRAWTSAGTVRAARPSAVRMRSSNSWTISLCSNSRCAAPTATSTQLALGFRADRSSARRRRGRGWRRAPVGEREPGEAAKPGHGQRPRRVRRRSTGARCAPGFPDADAAPSSPPAAIPGRRQPFPLPTMRGSRTAGPRLPWPARRGRLAPDPIRPAHGVAIEQRHGAHQLGRAQVEAHRHSVLDRPLHRSARQCRRTVTHARRVSGSPALPTPARVARPHGGRLRG